MNVLLDQVKWEILWLLLGEFLPLIKEGIPPPNRGLGNLAVPALHRDFGSGVVMSASQPFSQGSPRLQLPALTAVFQLFDCMNANEISTPGYPLCGPVAGSVQFRPSAGWRDRPES